jgi:splicing factor 3A subunit 1
MAEDEREAYIAAITELVKSRPASVPILPPKDVLYRVERTAETVNRRGKDSAMLQKLRDNTLTNFVDESSSYHPYWQWRLDEIAAGRGVNLGRGAGGGAENQSTGVSSKGRQVKVPEKPAEFFFSARVPRMSAQDFDVIKLTAKYAAANGQAWVTQLSQKMIRDPAFEFLGRQHTLYIFFEHLRDQYQSLFESEAANDGDILKRRIAELEANIEDPHRVIERARKRAEYNHFQESQKAAKEEKIEKDRIAYQQIDWHNFSVINPPIVFDEEDDTRDLPPPMSLQDLQSQSLEQRAAMRIGTDRRLEEAIPFMDEGQPLPAAQVPQYPAPGYPQGYPPAIGAYPPQPEDFNQAPSVQAERERARQQQEAARATAAAQPQRIVTNYVPAAQRRKQQAGAATSICPNCHQAIPNSEMEQHLRIEMLDPQWREQSRIAQQRSQTTNLSTLDVANNLKRLASQRSDVFDQVTGLAVSEEELARRKRAEIGAYDGNSPAVPGASGYPPGANGYTGAQLPPGMAPPPGMGPGMERPDVQEQIRRLHEKHSNR